VTPASASPEKPKKRCQPKKAASPKMVCKDGHCELVLGDS
jgi:hypothetical protein